MKTTIKETEKKITYTYIENGSNTVCFMLSGSNYLYDKPLMYYSTMAMLEHQFDIVHVHYFYEQSIFEMDVSELSELIIEDVDSVVDEVLAMKNYEEMIFLGKSLGTIPISFKYATNRTPNTKLVLFTPLLELKGLYEHFMQSSNEILLVLGTKDPHYMPSKIKEIKEKSTITFIEIEHGKHSLDIEPINTIGSLNAMLKISEALHRFIAHV